MSGDVQPRKRKDKKKKREDEASHGVHITKMGSDDVHLHIHEEHGTGGHWCAKIIFFSLMTILMGLVCLIILENRGISDVDTPLSESRFSNYFDGWVDESRDEHDDHHDSHGSLEHDDHDEHDDDEDDHDDEPFEEEADHSEGDEEVAEEEDENVTPEEEDEDDDNATAENVTAEEEDEDEDEDEDDEENITAEEDVDDNATAEEADDDNVTAEDENVTEEATVEQNEEDDEDDNKTNEEDDDDNATTETSKPTSQAVQDDDDDADDEDAFEEDEDDDGTFDSLEKMVDNDAAEIELLKEKARQQAAAESKENAASAENDLEDEADNAPSWASSQIKPKTGGGPQSLEDDDLDLFEAELRSANDEMMREYYDDALSSFDRLIQKYPNEPQTYLGKAQTLDQYSEQSNSNRMLKEAIELYKKYLKFNVTDDQLLEYRSAAERCLQKMRFLDQYEQCLPIHQLLIKKFPHIPSIRNDLVITYIMLNRLLDAKRVLQEILKIWPQDGLALVHYGFLLKYLYQDYHNASIYLRQGIDSKAEGTQDGRFYFLLGESLQRLGRQSEAVEIFHRGANLKLYPSAYQRSLHNEPNLKAQPFWTVEETTYEKHFKKLQDHWFEIKTEGLRALRTAGHFLDESENLRDKGEWKQLELYFRGKQNRANCLKTPITCSLIEEFPAARDCRRGQVKFSVIHTGTHVWPHCGPTNCRLRAHLGLVVPSGTRIRVANEERSWQVGKFLIFDDSFEHEVWHEGRGLRLVLIVDIWHPELSEYQRRSLFPI